MIVESDSHAIALALVAAACIGTSDFVYRSLGRRQASTALWMLVQSLAFMAVVGVAALPAGAGLGPGAGYGFATGPLNLLAFYCVMRALSLGEAIALAPVARLNFVVTAVLTVSLLGEAFTARRGVGQPSARRY